jgi:acyl-CoA synthetase (AMP-forming)/AMP-acid ligase II
MLLSGGRLRFVPDFRNPLQTAKLITSEGLETFCGVPSTFYALGILHPMAPFAMPTIRVVCSAGAAMDQSRLDVIRKIFPNARIFNNYGMTEAAPRISYVRDDDARFLEGTCGRPMRGVEVRVVDPVTHQPLPEKQTGMIVVRGPNITAGYLNDEEQTQKAFTADGFLISGDLGYLDQGYLYIRGRQDDVFNVGGEKVSPIEIERALLELEPVEACAVAGFRDERRGMVPIAFVKLRRPTARRELTTALKGKLTTAKIPPRFFEVRSFPMTANAKLQRRALSLEDHERIVREIL